MQKQIQSALISVFYKDGLEPIVRKLNELNISIYSTGGTQDFIENLGIPCISVESVTSYPSILGGRVKTLHPKVFGGILARRNREEDMQHVESYDIPLFDLVMVDLYPFEKTVASGASHQDVIEKIDDTDKRPSKQDMDEYIKGPDKFPLIKKEQLKHNILRFSYL